MLKIVGLQGGRPIHAGELRALIRVDEDRGLWLPSHIADYAELLRRLCNGVAPFGDPRDRAMLEIARKMTGSSMPSCLRIRGEVIHEARGYSVTSS